MTALEKAAKAITEEIRRQNVDPFGIANYSAIVPRIKWDNVARAAIESLRTPGAENSDRIFNAMLDRILREEV